MPSMLRSRKRPASSRGPSPTPPVNKPQNGQAQSPNLPGACEVVAHIVPNMGKSLAKAHGVLLEPRHPNLHLKDPLTESERQAVSDRIRRETTELAAGIIRVEQDARDRLNTVHLKCITLLCIATVAIGFVMIYLRPMLVPLILASFFMFLLEPVLLTMIDPPGALKRFCPQRVPAELMESPDTPTSRISASPSGYESFVFPGAQDPVDCNTHGTLFLRHFTWKIWGLFCVLFCVLLLVGVFGIVLYMAIDAIANFNWRKYTDSRNLRLLMSWFPQLGDNPDKLRIDRLLPWLLQGPLLNAVDLTLSIISQAFLTMLFLVFLLAHQVFETGGASVGIRRAVRRSMRRYIRIKTGVAFVLSLLCGGFYWYMEVDLWFLFFVATFVLCFIPHVGNTIAVLAPLLVVFLDPTKEWADLALCFIIPFIIHQLAANLVEPKLMASSLDLHPIVVLLALAFWTAIWGAVGAILSVPLTAVVRLVLLDVDHPYASPIVRLLKGEFAKIGAPPTPAASPRNVARSAPPSLKGNSPNRSILRHSNPSSPEFFRPKAESDLTGMSDVTGDTISATSMSRQDLPVVLPELQIGPPAHISGEEIGKQAMQAMSAEADKDDAGPMLVSDL